MTIEEMKRRKEERGFSYEAIARLSGLPIGTVQKVLNGYTRKPRKDTLHALERVFTTGSELAEMAGTPEYREYSVFTGRPLHPRGGKTAQLKEPAAEYRISSEGDMISGDLAGIPEDVRVELIDGAVYYMEAPTAYHQALAVELAMQLKDHVRGSHGDCKVFFSPADVHLFEEDDRTVLQPDIFVYCRRDRIRYKGFYGAPDLVIEILSPGTMDKDLFLKFEKYVKAGVRELWYVFPNRRKVTVYRDLPENLVPEVYGFDENSRIPVYIWEGKCAVDFGMIAAETDYLLSQE